MSLKKNKTVPPVVTTESMMESMVKKFDTDMVELETQRESALGVFRTTATKLQSINDKLSSCITNYEKMIDYITSKKEVAQRSMAENAAVRKKIVEIIGE